MHRQAWKLSERRKRYAAGLSPIVQAPVENAVLLSRVPAKDLPSLIRIQGFLPHLDCLAFFDCSNL